MRIDNKQTDEAKMELHFPHLTNGIAQPKRIRKARGRTKLVAIAIATVACVTAYTYS